MLSLQKDWVHEKWKLQQHQTAFFLFAVPVSWHKANADRQSRSLLHPICSLDDNKSWEFEWAVVPTNVSVSPTDVITSNAPHCLWLITVLFLHFTREKLLINFCCVHSWFSEMVITLFQTAICNTDDCGESKLPPILYHPPDCFSTVKWSTDLCVLKVKLLFHGERWHKLPDHLKQGLIVFGSWMWPSGMLKSYEAYR